MKSQHNYSTLLKLPLLMVFMMWSVILCAKEPVKLFEDATKAYMEQNYEAAIEKYEELVTSGKLSPEVYYNLGNSYYKTGAIASAILNYERALKLNPSDPDINYNLRIAYLATIDKIEPAPMVFYEKWWNNFVNNGSVHNRAIMTVILFWISFAFIAVYLFSNKVILRKITFFGAVIVLFIGLFSWYLTFSQYQHLNNNKGAVIFTESAYVKSSPDDKSSNLFMLHSGTRIEVIDELKDWKKIRIANGNEGWIEKEAIELI